MLASGIRRFPANVWFPVFLGACFTHSYEFECIVNARIEFICLHDVTGSMLNGVFYRYCFRNESYDLRDGAANRSALLYVRVTSGHTR